MKVSNFVRTVATFLLVIGTPLLSLAKDQSASDALNLQANAAAEQQSLERANALITALDSEGALAIDAYGNVQIKKSVIKQLGRQGRLKIENASYGTICQ